MRKSGYTPGPWRHDPQKTAIIADVPPDWYEEGDVDDEWAPRTTTVVDLWGAMGGWNSEADAILIAAAPDLLEALKTVRRIAGDIDIVRLSSARSGIIDVASDAIAKAEGVAP